MFIVHVPTMILVIVFNKKSNFLIMKKIILVGKRASVSVFIKFTHTTLSQKCQKQFSNLDRFGERKVTEQGPNRQNQL